jgi:hypothetical protein
MVRVGVYVPCAVTVRVVWEHDVIADKTLGVVDNNVTSPPPTPHASSPVNPFTVKANCWLFPAVTG